MLTSHGLLLKYRHDARFSFGDIGVWYVDRGAPGDRSHVSGGGIHSLDAHYFEIESVTGMKKCIPYHRIRRITYAGETVWER
ncbi:MAG: hypothetical protein A4E35_01342 [Methanoregula sp. PtaU1.Bin051]|nr:MAG: hypothetical protein A4E35_01342 [Methanoregula sp. PtaU1.Bin051]